MHKTAIQLVKNGCDMKFREATRHNQFDDWIAFLLMLCVRRMKLHATVPKSAQETIARERFGEWNALSFMYNTNTTSLLYMSVAWQFIGLSTGVDGEWMIFLTIDSAGQAHQNGCDMTRNIPQPIWCIGPQKVCKLSQSWGLLVSLFLFFAVQFLPCALSFYHSRLSRLRSFSHRSTLRTDTILFIKAGCDSRELYDKPTLMVKACPAFRQDARVCVFHEHVSHAALFGHHFLLIEIFKRWRPSVPSRSFILKMRLTYFFQLSLFLSYLSSYRLLVSRFDSKFDDDSFSTDVTDRTILPRNFVVLYITSGRTDAAWKTR